MGAHRVATAALAGPPQQPTLTCHCPDEQPRHQRAHAIASRAVWDTQTSTTSRYRCVRVVHSHWSNTHGLRNTSCSGAHAQVWHARVGLACGWAAQPHATARPPARRGICAPCPSARPAYAGAPRGYRQLVWLRRGHCRGWHGACDGHCYVGLLLQVLTGETAASAPSTRRVRCSCAGGPRSRGKLGVRPRCSMHVDQVMRTRVSHAHKSCPWAKQA